jgi:hypothetical protein
LDFRPEVKRSSRIWPFSSDRGKGPDAEAASLSIMPASPPMAGQHIIRVEAEFGARRPWSGSRDHRHGALNTA